MRRNTLPAFGKRLEGLSVVAIVGTLGAITFRVLGAEVGSKRIQACLATGQRLGQAAALYAVDFDDRLPDAGRWEDALGPYLGPGRRVCPNLPASPAGVSGFAMSRGLSAKRRGDLRESAVLIFETSLRSRNAFGDESAFEARHDLGYGSPSRGWIVTVSGVARMRPGL